MTRSEYIYMGKIAGLSLKETLLETAGTIFDLYRLAVKSKTPQKKAREY